MVIKLPHSGERTLSWLRKAGVTMQRIFSEGPDYDHSVDFMYEKCAKVLEVHPNDVTAVQALWETHFGRAYRDYLG